MAIPEVARRKLAKLALAILTTPGRPAASAIFKLVEAGDCRRVSDSTSQSLSLCRPAS